MPVAECEQMDFHWGKERQMKEIWTSEVNLAPPSKCSGGSGSKKVRTSGKWWEERINSEDIDQRLTHNRVVPKAWRQLQIHCMALFAWLHGERRISAAISYKLAQPKDGLGRLHRLRRHPWIMKRLNAVDATQMVVLEIPSRIIARERGLIIYDLSPPHSGAMTLLSNEFPHLLCWQE